MARPSASRLVRFAFVAAKNTVELLQYADNAFSRYNGFLPGENIHAPIQSLEVFPNPNNGDFRLEFELNSDNELSFDVYNLNDDVFNN